MSTSFHKFCLFLLFVLLRLSVSGQTVCLKVIQTTDVHGSVAQGKFGRVAALIQQERKAAGGPGSTLLIDCGDLLQGSFPMTLDRGGTMIRALNLLSYDIFVPGNHDFEFGSDSLRNHLKQFAGTVCAANLDWKDASSLCKWTLLKKNGLSVAVIGVSFPALDNLLYGNQLQSVRLLDGKKEMARIMPEVMKAEPAVILLAVHAGEYTPFSSHFPLSRLIRQYPQIDLVLGGHTHQDVPGKSLAGHSWFLQAPAHAGGIAVADITYDLRKHRVTSLRSRLVYADNTVEPLPEMEKLLSGLLKRSRQVGAEKIAPLPFPLKQLSGEAVREYTGAPVVFLKTYGQFQKNMDFLTRKQLFALAPYEDGIGVMNLTPSECRKVLEEQHSKKRSGMFQTPFGILYSMGSAGKIQGSLRLKGESGGWTDEKRTVPCAFTTFALAGAGGRFPVLRALALQHAVKTYPENVRTVLERYLREHAGTTHKTERK